MVNRRRNPGITHAGESSLRPATRRSRHRDGLARSTHSATRSRRRLEGWRTVGSLTLVGRSVPRANRSRP